jgi:hypothetical protein
LGAKEDVKTKNLKQVCETCDVKRIFTITVVDSDEKSPETQTEDMVGNLHIKRIHAQLRRMTKNSNFSQDVILTAIPEHRSKVQQHFLFDPLKTDGDLCSQGWNNCTKKLRFSKYTDMTIHWKARSYIGPI